MTWAFAQKVGGNEKLVLLALADHADEEWSCYPGMETLAAKASVSVRTVQNVLARLEEAGYLTRERRHSQNTGYRTSNRYTLLTANPALRPNGKIEEPNGNLFPLEREPSVEPSVNKRATTLPKDWKPNDSHRERALARGVLLDYQAEQFRLHAQATGRRMVNWNAAFTMWLNNAKPSPFRGPKTDSQRVLDIFSIDMSSTTLEDELRKRIT